MIPGSAAVDVLALALDLGGTKLEAALVAGDGTVVPGSRVRTPTGADLDHAGLRAALARVTGDALHALPDGAALRGAGIGSAGPIDRTRGTIDPVNMPGVRGFRLGDETEAAVRAAGVDGITVRVGHDGGCLALAESWMGATQDARASLSIVVSTGIGGGFVFDGMPIGGASGNAGHLGQISSAGVTLEEIASGPASVAWAQEHGWTGSTGEQLGRDAASGDRIARAAIERSAAAVGQALADAATLCDLDVIAIGGGFSRVSEDYIALVGAALLASAVLPYARAAQVVRSGLGDEGPLIGAAALVLRGSR